MNDKYPVKLVLYSIFLLLSFFLNDALGQKKRYTNLKEALYAKNSLVGSNGPSSINWIEEGARFSYIDPSTLGQQISVYDPRRGKDIVVFNGQGMKFPGKNEDFSYTSFQWTKDAKQILFQSNFRKVWNKSGISDYYLYSIANRSLKLVVKDAYTAEVSPDGKKIAYEKEGNLFIYDFTTYRETQLTHGAKPSFYNGRASWVYEKEFGLAKAWEWSPDSRYIAFWQSDDNGVPLAQITDYSGQHAQYDKLPYPKVGDSTPKVKIGVIDLADKSLQWLDLPVDGYMPRIYWTSARGWLAVVHLNREQNHLRLYFCNGRNGNSKLIMDEQSDTWIDISGLFADINHFFVFPRHGNEFFWVSDRDGWSHIYRYSYSGKLIQQVTGGKWEVSKIEAVDTKNRLIYYTSTEKSPLERHLYVIDFTGRRRKKLTKTAGRHIVDVSPNGRYYIDRYSNTDKPTQVELWSSNGKLIKKIEKNQSVTDYLKKNEYAPRELFRFTASDGQKLDGYLIKPPNFDPEKPYPLVLNIYGAPSAQSVYNEFATDGWEQYLAQQGYIVASVNNRGSGGYGSKFEKVVYKRLGEWESKDFIETANYLSAKPWVDVHRMAIRGHSYGGYMSSYTMFNYPGVFKVSLVGAPVADWRLYNNIYTERYMGLFSENAEGYIQSASTTHAPKLDGHMLIVHASMDENVHIQNTMQLVKVLIDNGKDHDLRIYPSGKHGVAYSNKSYELLYLQYVDYLEKYLKQ